MHNDPQSDNLSLAPGSGVDSADLHDFIPEDTPGVDGVGEPPENFPRVHTGRVLGVVTTNFSGTDLHCLLIDIPGFEPREWFVVQEVAVGFGYSRPDRLQSSINRSWRATFLRRQRVVVVEGDLLAQLRFANTNPVFANSKIRSLMLISEDGLYRATTLAGTETAELFCDFVCGVILPQLRKTGSVSLPGHASLTPEERALRCREATLWLGVAKAAVGVEAITEGEYAEALDQVATLSGSILGGRIKPPSTPPLRPQQGVLPFPPSRKPLTPEP